MSFGDHVIYTGDRGDVLGIIEAANDDGTLNIRWWDLQVGDSGYVPNVPRSDAGGGNTWRPIS